MQPLVSGEGVALDLPLAGPGSRAAAAVIDLAIQLLALVVAFVVLSVVATGGADPAAVAAVVVTLVVLVFGGYPVLSEWLSGGRTIGKLALGLRVVRDDAGPIAFRHALVRGVCSLVFEKPGILLPVGTAIGLITATSSGSWKRVGDVLAGTVVVQDRHRDLLVAGAGLVPPPPMWAWAAGADLGGLDGELGVLVRSFVGRAAGLRPEARRWVEQELAARVAAVVSPPPPAGAPPEALLVTVLAERRRRALTPFR